LRRVGDVKYFLLVYDRPRAELVETPVELADHLYAPSARFEREKADPNPDHEVIVLGGESLASLADTHARHFWRSAAEPAA